MPIFGAAAAEPELEIESEFNYLFGKGGAKLTIDIRGDLARELRQDIYDDFLINPKSMITDVKRDAFMEAMEDRFEQNIDTRIVFNDSLAHQIEDLDYKKVYKITRIDHLENRVEINSIDGLVGTSISDTSTITIKMDLEGSPVEDSEIILSDGYIILYVLFGNETYISVDVKETCRIMTVGMNGYSDFKLESGGEITRYRLVMGELIEYKHNYKLNGLELSKNEKDTIHFDSFNAIENSLVLAIIILVFSIIAGMFGKHLMKKRNVERVLILRIMWLVFFIILVIIYIIGFSGTIIFVSTLLFFAINMVLNYGIYEKGWGRLVKTTVRHEDFVRTPPKIDEGPWHERGIANARVGNFLEAVSCFENALEAEPENATIWNDLGFVLRKLGKYRQALDCFKKALKLRPDYPVAKENLEKTKREMEARTQRRK